MRQASDSKQLTLPVGKRDRILGAIDAPVIVVEYGDYQSPQCRQAHVIVKEIQRCRDEQLCFVFRHFPQTELHPQAQKTAEVAAAAATQGKFWEMHDTLFEHQQALDDASLIEYAIALGLDITQLLRALSSRVYAQRVQEDFHSGMSSGVNSTPTFFINGILQADACNVERLVAAIEQASHFQLNTFR